MTERGLAIIGVAAIIVAAMIAITFVDQPVVGVVANLMALGLGQLVNLVKLGTNTELTQKTAHAVNGCLDERMRNAVKAGVAEALKEMRK